MQLSLPDSFFRTAQNPMWVFEEGTLRFLDVNESACARYGYTREEFLGMTLLDIRSPEEQELFRNRHLYPGRFWEHRTKSGEILFIQGYEFPFESEGTEAILAMIADATERVKLEREKTELLKRYQILSEAANDLLWDWDLQTNQITHSEAIVTQYGYSREDLQRPIEWWSDKIHPDDFSIAAWSIQEAIRERRRYWTAEYRLKKADGTYVLVLDRGILHSDENDKPLRMVGSIVDLTTRKAAEDDRNQLFRLSIDSMLFLEPDGTITQANAAFHALVGGESVELKGKNLREYFCEQDRSEFEEAVKNALENSLEGHFTSTLETAGEAPRTIQWGLITNEAKNRLFLVGRDITESNAARTELEKALLSSQEFALEAQAARKAQSEFLQNMSHELRTPMNGMLGTAQILASLSENERQKELTTILVRSGETLLQILNDILDLSKIESGKILLEQTPFHLSEAIQSVFDLFSPSARQKGLAFTMALAPEAEVSVLGDPFRLRQVLSNLLGNAIKFTDSGAIGLFLNASLPKQDQIKVVITIRDTGMGIAPEMQATIFDRFVQADSSMTRRHGGTGLGLAIARTIVDLMNGSIEVDSALGRGSTFTLSLPFTIIKNAPTMSTEMVTTAHCPRPGMRLLIAEDVEVNAMILRCWLEERGFGCEVVTTGSEAIKRIQQAPFDGAFVDLHMPDASGYDVVSAVRFGETGTSVHLPIVAVTASVSLEERKRCLDQGFDAYIPKPILISDLDRVVQNLFN